MIYKILLPNLIKFLFMLFLFIPLSLLIIVIFLLHKLSFQGKFFFIQDRVGIHQKIIKLVKIKSMKNNKITSFGYFLKNKIRWIPQFSILSGDLNFIGPRPLLIDYNDFYKNSES